ncbi:MAG: PAS domain-containing protein, partial [Oceanobacter sp.]
MTFSLSLICMLVLGYLGLLYLAAHSVEQGWVPKSWVQQPATYLLSLGVYASAWGYYGTIGMGQQYGLGYLAYFLGLSGAFLLAPVLLKPIFLITRSYQLSSMADLMAFRFCSPLAGKLVSIAMIIMAMPLMTLQIKALTETLLILSPGGNSALISLAFTALLAVSAIVFGARHIALRHNHEGLVFALAIETLVKLAAVSIGGVALLFWFIPDIPGGDLWRPDVIDYLKSRPLSPPDGPSLTLLPMCLAIAISMPHTFHMTFTENDSSRALKTATWAFPLLLLLMTLMIPPLLWAGSHLNIPDTEYWSLEVAIAQESPWITLVFYFGGIAAATGVTIQMTLVSSSMLLNHLLTPHFGPGPNIDIYRWLLQARRGLIVAILFTAYLLYLIGGDAADLSRLGIMACGIALQFVPGIVGLLYWQRANRQGFLIGMVTGCLIWLIATYVPLLFDLDRDGLLLGVAYPDASNWHYSAWFSLAVNLLLYVTISIFSTTRREETESANACKEAQRNNQRPLVATNSNDAIIALSRPLGRFMAEREVHLALKDLGLPGYEDRPHELRRLRVQLQTNLSTLMGSTISEDIISRYLPLNTEQELDNDLYLIEQRLEGFHDRLSGLSAELDHMRRHHRETLERLPVGACSLSEDGEILLWNRVMVEMTGIAAERVNGTLLADLPKPWGNILGGFIVEFDVHQYKRQIEINGNPRWYNLHKSILESRPGQSGG